MKYLAFFLLLSLCFSSCAFHSGVMTGSASLSQPNFRVTQQSVSGSSKTTKILGFGGLMKTALVAEAKKDLVQKAGVTDRQALANVAVDFKTSLVFFVIVQRCTVTADVIEFNR
ncbi:hypothetical protein LX87_01677 [Larkinella arboricola]|uniref:Lipoprotein n=1 Tax=Larkinella arboricola TaxID=643671 RepID=A0A327X1I6_LARAB|nr:DUF6567 family protein [Larkinella arboricola]RAJ99979.1 hypothetical protein LX87_01677 [Larkinella arboricola]